MRNISKTGIPYLSSMLPMSVIVAKELLKEPYFCNHGRDESDKKRSIRVGDGGLHIGSGIYDGSICDSNGAGLSCQAVGL